MAELTIRSTYRAKVTRLSNSIKEYLNSDQAQLNSTDADFEKIEEELQSFIDRISNAFSCLKNIDKAIIEKNLIHEDNLQDEYDKMADYEDTAIDTISRLKVRIGQVRQRLDRSETDAVIPNETENNDKDTLTHKQEHSKAFVKLERIKLKQFSGELKDWLPFWQQFQIAVHENKCLTDVEKFTYLQNSLEGRAAKTIEGFTPSSECYESAVQLLQEEYGNTGKIIDATIQQLMNITQVHDRYDIKGLRHLYNTVQSHTRSLSVLQVPCNNYSVMLKNVLLKALPHELRIEYHRYAVESEKKNSIMWKQWKQNRMQIALFQFPVLLQLSMIYMCRIF